MKFIWFTGIATLTLSHAVAAPEPVSDIPSYNVEKYCIMESKLLGDDTSILKFCLEQEQKSYDELKTNWNSVDKKVKDDCQQTPETSYYKLKVCIAREIKTKEELSDFKFRK